MGPTGYLCICVFVYLCICVFVYLCICVFVYFQIKLKSFVSYTVIITYTITTNLKSQIKMSTVSASLSSKQMDMNVFTYWSLKQCFENGIITFDTLKSIIDYLSNLSVDAQITHHDLFKTSIKNIRMDYNRFLFPDKKGMGGIGGGGGGGGGKKKTVKSNTDLDLLVDIEIPVVVSDSPLKILDNSVINTPDTPEVFIIHDEDEDDDDIENYNEDEDIEDDIDLFANPNFANSVVCAANIPDSVFVNILVEENKPLVRSGSVLFNHTVDSGGNEIDCLTNDFAGLQMKTSSIPSEKVIHLDLDLDVELERDRAIKHITVQERGLGKSKGGGGVSKPTSKTVSDCHTGVIHDSVSASASVIVADTPAPVLIGELVEDVYDIPLSGSVVVADKIIEKIIEKKMEKKKDKKKGKGKVVGDGENEVVCDGENEVVDGGEKPPKKQYKKKDKADIVVPQEVVDLFTEWFLARFHKIDETTKDPSVNSADIRKLFIHIRKLTRDECRHILILIAGLRNRAFKLSSSGLFDSNGNSFLQGWTSISSVAWTSISSVASVAVADEAGISTGSV